METPRRILVVDDDQGFCRLLSTLFSADNYSIESVHDGESALKAVERSRPDLVILDLLLPGMDGFSVCKRLRENPALWDLRILMLTGVYLSEEDVHNGFRIGADAYVVKPDLILNKPVRLEELRGSIEALFREAAPPPSSIPRDRILVVDDDEKNRRMLRMRLSGEGFEIREAASAQEALAAVDAFLPHLILSDIQMPGMSGLELLPQIRAKDARVPIVMMTAFGSETIVVEAFEKGADDYLIKPFDHTTAVRRIRWLIEKYHVTRSGDQLMARLKIISCDLVDRVNHLEIQNQKLEEAYASVRGIAEFNRRFIRLLSQELKAPLASILGFADLLQEAPPGERDPALERTWSGTLYRTAFQLEIRLSNLLYLSRVQADALKVVPGPFLLEPAVEETLALAARALGRAEVRIQWYPEGTNPRIVGDRTMLKDILVNLLQNSLRRIEGAGEILLELTDGAPPPPPNGGTPPFVPLKLRIRDSGLPYGPRELEFPSPKDLDPDSLKGGAEPMRLGLCRHLARASGWELELTNRPTGGGEAVLDFFADGSNR